MLNRISKAGSKKISNKEGGISNKEQGMSYIEVAFIIRNSPSDPSSGRACSLFDIHLPLPHDNRAIKNYERPCFGFEEVSLTSRTDNPK